MTLLENYEQQYASLIAEITSQIGRLTLTNERRELCAKIDGSLTEAQELLEQMGLEIRELNGTQRTTATNKLNCAQVELKRLQTEYANAKDAERTGNRLQEGYRVLIETETLGAQVLSDLHHQRETIQSSRGRLRETNAELGRASRTLNTMMLRALREKAVLYVVGGFFIVAVVTHKRRKFTAM
ncbi:hypothetical protein DOY81_001199 [Sarcophaga bullata]|nr:hypothetical protein DOY81_001199 [Sarcophaga bullata]